MRPRLHIKVSPEEEREICDSVREAGRPTRTFVVLTLLSTVIAAYGLMSNSTATIIGAMVVAPLMGPIVGSAFGLVEGHASDFGRSLAALLLGATLCVGTACLVALVAGVDNIDFSQSEIIGRTRPTLYDLAVGLAAGLAGAYVTINRRLSGSMAGVAIAVALVPPLAVTGLTLAGSTHHPELLRSALGSYMLFQANFLAIQLAAVLVFALAGLGHLAPARKLVGALGIQLVLLPLTLAFLSSQLSQLVNERRVAREAREVVRGSLAGIPGASLDSLELTLDGEQATIKVVVLAPMELPADHWRTMRRGLALKLARDVDLVASTLLSSYYSPQGRLYVPQPTEDPAQAHLHRLDQALRGALALFPQAELLSFRELDTAGHVLMDVRSSFEFSAYQVSRLQQAASQQLGRLEPSAPALQLTVRTELSREFNAQGPVQSDVDIQSPEEKRLAGLKSVADGTMQKLVAQVRGGELGDTRLNLELPPSPPPQIPSPALTPAASPSTPSPILSPGLRPAVSPTTPSPVAPPTLATAEVDAVVRSARPLDPRQVEGWRQALEQSLGLEVRLTIDNRLGQTLSATPSPRKSSSQPGRPLRFPGQSTGLGRPRQ